MESFEFDLDFLGQAPNDCDFIIPDVRELSRRIADTNDLVLMVNSLNNENEVLRKQLTELGRNIEELQAMCREENRRANCLSVTKDHHLSRIYEAEKELSNLKSEVAQKYLLYNQRAQSKDIALENLKKQNDYLKSQLDELNEKFLNLSSEKGASKLSISQDGLTTKAILPSECVYNALGPAKKRDSNRTSRMVSRGTQYQYSTTTRSTCTSAFIKKHNVAVNFPEVMSVAIEDIFKETLVELPNIHSPIQDDPELFSSTASQMHPNKSTKKCSSIGTCTKLCNVRCEINYVSDKKSPPQSFKKGTNWEHLLTSTSLGESNVQLSELWDLLGQTIFALINSNTGTISKNDILGQKIDKIKSRLLCDKQPVNFNNISSSNGFAVENVPKVEKNASYCSSPIPDTESVSQREDTSNWVNHSNQTKNLTNERLRSDQCLENNTCDNFKVDPIVCNESVLNDDAVNAALDDKLMLDDQKLAIIKEEMEMLERKTLVISPIRDHSVTFNQTSCNLPIKEKFSSIINSCQADPKHQTFQNICHKDHLNTVFRDKIKCKSSDLNLDRNLLKSSKEEKRFCSQMKRKLKRQKLKINQTKCVGKFFGHISQNRNPVNNPMEQEVRMNYTNIDEDEPVALQKAPTSIYMQKIRDIGVRNQESIDNNVAATEKYLKVIYKSIRGSNVVMMNVPKDFCSENIPEFGEMNNVKVGKQISDETSMHLSSPPVFGTYESVASSPNVDLFQHELHPSFTNSTSRCTSDANNNQGNEVSESESEEEDFFGFAQDDFYERMICTDSSDEDNSPTSPEPMHEEIIATIPKLIPLERLAYEQDYSPASPLFKHLENPSGPREIPLNRTRYKRSTTHRTSSLLERFVFQYKVARHRLCVQNSPLETPKKRKLIWLLRKMIELYLLTASNEEENLKAIKYISRRCSGHVDILCNVICEVIEDTNEEINKEFTPPAIVMTKSHQRILLLIKHLDHYINGFEKILLFKLDQRIFVLKSDSINPEPLINLFLLYIGLIDTQNFSVNPMRLLMFKCLYYYSQMAYPMIYYILMSYPSVLPGKDETYYADPDPLVYTIECILNNRMYNLDNTYFKHRELYHILRLYYKYDRVKPTREEAVELLLQKIHLNQLHNVAYTFALLCKRNETKWTVKYVLEGKLLPALSQYTTELSENKINDEKISCILDCISAILKPFPVNSDISFYRKLFVNFLFKTDRQNVQQAAALAILRTSRFGSDESFLLLHQWSPAFRISELLQLSMESFVHRSTLKKLKALEKLVKNIS